MPTPSVILFMSDEHPVFMAGCYGDAVAQTPTLDAFARGGAVMDSAYCASPICAPCRAAMLTSREVHDLEVWDNASPLRSDWPTFAHAFAAAGYRTVLCGKMHFVGPDQLHGFTERWVPDIYPATFDWSRPSRDRLPIQENRKGQNRHSVLAAGPGTTWDMPYDDLVVATAERRLPELLASTRPFLLVVSVTGPHYPFAAPREFWDRFDPASIPLPEIRPGHRDHEMPGVRSVRTAGQFDEPVPVEVVRRARHAVYARIAMVDGFLARILNAVETGGRKDDLLLSYTSDHGDMLGEHELFFKNTAYEWSARVPLIWRGPGIVPARIPETTSLLDLGPTLLGLAGVPALPVPAAGRDLALLLQGGRPPGPGRAVIENYGEGIRRGLRTLVSGGRWKLTLGVDQPGELYDLRADPGEWDNRFDDPALAEVQAAMAAELRAGWGDPRQHDEHRWQSEERRAAILGAWGGQAPVWQEDWRSLLARPGPEAPA